MNEVQMQLAKTFAEKEEAISMKEICENDTLRMRTALRKANNEMQNNLKKINEQNGK